MADALINHDVLLWAMQQAHMTASELAGRLGLADSKVAEWLDDTAKPTLRQAQHVADALNVPLGYLFLRQPPSGFSLPIPDLRTVGNRRVTASPELRDILTDVLYKHDWYKEDLQQTGREELAFVGQYTITSGVKVVADAITEALSLSVQDRECVRNWEAFLKLLIERCEDLGIWVLCNGVVGSNTHRKLDVEDFRGFAVCDSVCPLVFINNSDSKAAQIFTLVHELVHIWVGESGISELGVGSAPEDGSTKVEVFCNKVAAEVLVPAVLLRQRSAGANCDEEWIREEASYFRVSSVMLARRCADIGAVDWSFFWSFYRTERIRWQRSSSGGGNFYNNVPVRNGRAFTNRVLATAQSGAMLLRDAGRLLNVNASKIHTLAEWQGV